MQIIALLIPVALFLGALGLAAFVWSVKSGQFDDPDGAAYRILIDDHDRPAESSARNAEFARAGLTRHILTDATKAGQCSEK